MKSKMNPDNFFSIRSKVIDKFSSIFYGIVFLGKYSHSLRTDLPIWMKEFIDKVDDDKRAFHIF